MAILSDDLRKKEHREPHQRKEEACCRWKRLGNIEMEHKRMPLRGATEARRPLPWEGDENARQSIPETLPLSFSIAERGMRYYLDVLFIRGLLEVKIAKKSMEERSFVCFLLQEMSSEEEKHKIMALSGELQGEELEKIEDWNPSVGASTWVTIRGIPVHLWCMGVFQMLAGVAGRVVELDPDAVVGERLDCLRARVELKKPLLSDLQIPILEGGRMYKATVAKDKKKRKRQKSKRTSKDLEKNK